MNKSIPIETFCPEFSLSESELVYYFKQYMKDNCEGNYVFGCFEYYFYKKLYDVNENFYFGFLILPYFYKRFINKFNRKFNNIKIEVIYEDDVYTYVNDYGTLNVTDDIKGTLHKSALFKVSFSEEYSEKAKVFLGYVVHHLIRLLSLGEGYVTDTEEEHPKNKCSIEQLVEINNRICGGRALSSNELEISDILIWDDIEKINERSKYLDATDRQTKIVKYLSGKSSVERLYEGNLNREELNVGDLVVHVDVKSPYGITNNDMVLGMVTDRPSTWDGIFNIKILAHDITDVYLNRTFPVNSLYFRKITDDELYELLDSGIIEDKYENLSISEIREQIANANKS